VEVDVLENRPFEVRTRFELAAVRMADTWIRTRRLRVSPEDFRIVRDYLERDGWTVEDVPGVRVRLRHRTFRSEEMTREAAVLVALRRLVLPTEARRDAVQAAPEALPPLAVAIEISEPARTCVAAFHAGSPA
jgi:hypothetical protein